MFRTFAVVTGFLTLLGGGYLYSSVHGQAQAKTQGEICHLDKVKSAKPEPMNTYVSTQDPQQPQEPQEPEGDKHCERPDPNGDPNVGATDPKRVGCTCKRKCENGKPTENYEEGKRCKVHCKPDHCHCPNPCKT